MPSRESPINMAKKLCIGKAEEIGGLTNENIVDQCIKPVSQYIETQVANWVSSKSA